MTWQRIRLNLARTDDFPQGSVERGYEIMAPITEDGHFDEAEWRADKKRARVRRFWSGEADEIGNLIHTRHRTWAVSYAPGEEDDEPIFRLETHKLSEGEYISITEHDGTRQPFQIVAMAPAERQ